MLQGIIIRGTTPEHEFELPYPLELIGDIRVIYGQGGRPTFTKTKEDCVLSEGKISVLLTQEETLSVLPSKPLDIEIRIKLTNGKVVRTEEPISLRVIGSMDNEVMV